MSNAELKKYWELQKKKEEQKNLREYGLYVNGKNIEGFHNRLKIIDKLRFFQKDRCFYCLVKLDSSNATIDHYIPKRAAEKFYNGQMLTRLPKDIFGIVDNTNLRHVFDNIDKVYTASNLVACCKECNTEKSSFLPRMSIIEAKKIFYKRLKEIE